ncbi:hypothetical protein HH310_29860 [Actinoplanes sp. TBRC 11911]|uniref:WXG100 family type VII secretion target n=1 Tax=Actinoplanes sp. TBRC 11911 TaxID=2729386 RepID=UPI00145E5BCC|nr:hypothetical protein [Actinoplanes sp. TBRC 11911]NMO55376.1 hypothetical protein [Actinoplanes sp. TBRC 11911]
MLNADSMDSRQFVNRSWLTLLNAGYYIKAKGSNPQNDPMGTQDKNEFTLYRRTAEDYDGVQSHIAYWIIKGTVSWYTKDGDASPHDHFQNEWKGHSNSVLNTPPSPLPLDPQSFYTAANSFYNLERWLEDSAKRLQNEISKIDSHASGFKGSSAQAFQVALTDLQNEMKLLRDDLATSDEWARMLNANGDAAKEFWEQVRQAWADFTSHPEYEPNNMIAKTMADIERAIDELGTQTSSWNRKSFDDGSQVVWQDLKNWWIDIDFGNGPKSYDFRDPGTAIGALDTDMHNYFHTGVASLHEKMAQQLQKLRESFEHSYQNMSDLRTYVPLPPPKQDPNVGGAGTGGGGGGGIDLSGLFKHGGDNGGSGDGGGVDLGDLLSHGGGSGGGDGANLGDLLNRGGGSSTGGGGPNFNDLVTTAGGGGGLNGGQGNGDPDFTTSDFAGDPGGSSGGFSGPNLGSGGIGGTGGGGAGLPDFLPPPIAGSGKPNDTKPGGVAGGLDEGDFDQGPSAIGGLPHGDDSGITLPSLGGSSGSGGALGPGKDGGVLAHLGGAAGPSSVTGLGGGAGSAGAFGGNTPAGDTGGIDAPLPPNGIRTGPLGSAPANTGIAGDDGLFGADGDTAEAGGMPFMPPMGGLGGVGGQDKDKDRERTTWLAEEEEVWGTDPDLAPSVIGRDQQPDGSAEDRVPRSPASSSPYGPARGTGRQTGRSH